MTDRIAQRFTTLKAEGKTAFIPFIMGGDPNYDTSLALLKALPAAGADIIELGIPFSDPMADGPAIQAAGLRALEAGQTLRKTLDMVATFREEDSDTPIILMGYYNPIYHFGVETFAKEAAKVGVDGLICVDVPHEEANELAPLSAEGIAPIPLIAPPSLTPERLTQLTARAAGYLYYVSIAGITGAAAATKESVANAMEQIRAITPLPTCVGFGIKTREDVARLEGIADGVIVGSALVRTIETMHSENAASQEIIDAVVAQVKELAGHA